MKTWRISVALFGAAVMCGSTVLAGEVNKVTIKTDETLNVEGKSLNPGTYKVEWNGTGPNVQVKMVKGKDIVATFPAHVQQQGVQNPANAYGSKAEANGTRELTAIYVGGKRDVLQLQPNSASQQSAGNPGAK
jgi:hypothetical protein